MRILLKIIRRIYKPALCLLLLFVIALFLTNWEMISSSKQYIYTQEQIGEIPEVDSILVLGAKVHDEGRLSVILRDRVDVGIQAYRRGVSGKLLFSGDHGRTEYDEVNAMLSHALENGVRAADAFLDHAGFSTYESMYRARDVFQNRRVLIVTQDFHLSRAVYIARKMGLEAYGLSADLRNYGNTGQQVVREAFARSKDWLSVNLFAPEPTYLGDAIPITGDATVTHDKPVQN